MNLRDQPALVTGAGRRVGRAIAEALAAEGARVAVHFNVSSSGAEETVRLIEAQGGEARAFPGDLTDPATPERLIGEVTKALGGVAILVNSAAIFEETPWPVDDAAWARHLDLNLTAPMRLIRAATPELTERRGVVINIADACWQRPTWTRHVAHCVSKAALVALTQNLARTLAPEVRVNAVAPGAVLPPDDLSEAQLDEAVGRVPLGHWGRPENVAQAVVALVGNDYVTGETLTVDGGRSVV